MLAESIERIIDHQDIRLQRRIFDHGVHDHRRRTPAPLGSVPFARVIHQDMAHHPGGDAQELGTALPIELLDAGKLQIELVHQGGGLQSPIAALGGENSSGQTRKSVLVAAAPILEASRDVASRGAFLFSGGHSLQLIFYVRGGFRRAFTPLG